MKNTRVMSVYELKRELEDLERKIDHMVDNDEIVDRIDLDRLTDLTEELYERF